MSHNVALEITRPEEELLHEPVLWSVAFADGRIHSIRKSSWDAFSHVEDVDGVSLFVSDEPIEAIMVTREKCSYLLKMEEPAHCFAFHRWRTALTSNQTTGNWLYSAFGYARGDQRVILQITDTIGRTLIQKRTNPFDLVAFGQV